MRDNELDWGNTEQPSSTLLDTPRGFIPYWTSPDIKIDAPPYASAPADSNAFDVLPDENPLAGAVNHVYVRVRNRGVATAGQVRVKLHWAFAGAGLPALPSDFWTTFPQDSTDTSKWKPLNAQTLGKLMYSGASVAGTAQDAAQIAEFDFAAPPFDSSLPSPSHYCLLAIVDSTQDPVAAASKGSQIVDEITPRDNNIAQKNVVLVEGLPITFQFYLRNPFDRPITTMLRLDGSKGWQMESDGITLGESVRLDPNAERLITVKVDASGTQPVNILQVTTDATTGKEKVLGGLSVSPAAR